MYILTIKGQLSLTFFFFAEAEGFEPPVRCRTTVFKTAAIDHSAKPPCFCGAKI